jgi:hypothetical protein
MGIELRLAPERAGQSRLDGIQGNEKILLLVRLCPGDLSGGWHSKEECRQDEMRQARRDRSSARTRRRR